MPKKTVRDVDVSKRRLLVRVDFNVPLGEDGRITNDRRIRLALPTVRYGLERGASLVLMTHLGRPKGERKPRLALSHVADRLQKLLGDVPVERTEDVAGDEAQRAAEALQPGEVLLLENLRFDPGEKSGDSDFAERLRRMGEIYVNDAFSASHRKHASMFAAAELFPQGSRVIGLLMESELSALDSLLDSPRKPMVAVLGGAKVADKIGVVEALLDRVETLMIGGAMAYTFMKARGSLVGESRVEDDKVDLAARLLDRAGDKLVLPDDHLVAREPAASAKTTVVEREIPEGWVGVDIGPKTREHYSKAIHNAATVVWNGPLGMFEAEPFRSGTETIVRALAETEAATIVGGGESAEAVEQFGLIEQIDHVSTGGGAFLEYLEKGTLSALSVIDDK